MFLDEQSEAPQANFELLHATSGEEAVEIIARSREAAPVGVAFVDIRMPPGIDGVETVRRIRSIDRDIEVVLMTAYTDKRLTDLVHDMELIHKLLYIRKPFAREEVQQIALSLAAKWNLEQQLTAAREQLAATERRLQALLDATAPEEILPLAEIERRAVLRTLEAMDNNISKTAKALGISRSTLYRKAGRVRKNP